MRDESLRSPNMMNHVRHRHASVAQYQDTCR